MEYLISASLSEEGTLFILIKMVPYSQTLAAQQTRQTSFLPACRRLYTGRCVKMSDCLRMLQRQAQRIWAQGLEMRLQINGALICEALLTKIKGVFQRTDWEERCRDLREHACLYRVASWAHSAINYKLGVCGFDSQVGHQREWMGNRRVLVYSTAVVHLSKALNPKLSSASCYSGPLNPSSIQGTAAKEKLFSKSFPRLNKGIRGKWEYWYCEKIWLFALRCKRYSFEETIKPVSSAVWFLNTE